MVRERDGSALDRWLQAVAASELAPLQSFARGLEQDRAAVEAALTMTWSNGQTEGQVNRAKMLKRHMSGRANFDLLRKRILHAA